MIQRLFFLGLLVTLSACSSNESKADNSAEASAVECICGEPEAAFDGCAHPMCIAGKGNPDNPECVCGPLTY